MRPSPPPVKQLSRRERFNWSVGLSYGPDISTSVATKLAAIFRGEWPSGAPTLLGNIDISTTRGDVGASMSLLPDGENSSAQVRLYAWSDGVVTWVPHRTK